MVEILFERHHPVLSPWRSVWFPARRPNTGADGAASPFPTARAKHFSILSQNFKNQHLKCLYVTLLADILQLHNLSILLCLVTLVIFFKKTFVHFQVP